MRRRSLLRIAVAVALAGAGAGLAWWITTPPAVAEAPVLAARAAAVLPEAAPAPRPAAPGPSAASAAAAAPASAARSPFPAPGLAARVDAWARSDDPRDALKAYEAVRDCLQARREDRTPEERLTADDAAIARAVGAEALERMRLHRHHAELRCRDLRSDQVESRLAWLVRAARAGVADAASDFIQEGPEGRHMMADAGASWPVGTESWYAQRDAYIDAALRHCDLSLVAYLTAVVRLPGMDLQESQRLWMGHLQCPGGPVPPPLRDDPVARAALDRFQHGQDPPPLPDPPASAPA
jgi:hypothetical protein